MEEDPKDSTLSEILEEDIKSFKRNSKRRSCLFRLLIIATLLFVGFYGFILFRQHLLNLEAEAIIMAGQTATADSGEIQPEMEVDPDNGQEQNANSEHENEPTKANDVWEIRTATISAMLTSVAEFQLTQTPE